MIAMKDFPTYRDCEDFLETLHTFRTTPMLSNAIEYACLSFSQDKYIVPHTMYGSSALEGRKVNCVFYNIEIVVVVMKCFNSPQPQHAKRRKHTLGESFLVSLEPLASIAPSIWKYCISLDLQVAPNEKGLRGSLHHGTTNPSLLVRSKRSRCTLS